MIAYILDYYIEEETYPHTIYINEDGIIGGLFTKINKCYFDIERVVYKAFNNVFNPKIWFKGQDLNFFFFIIN